MRSDAEKASRLFQFLSELQRKRERTVYESSQYKDRGGTILTLEGLEKIADETDKVDLGPYLRAAVSSSHLTENQGIEGEDVLVTFKKPMVVPPSPLGALLSPWVEGELDNPRKRPSILERIEVHGREIELSHKDSDFRDSLEGWLQRWDEWARDVRYSETYQEIFEIQTSVNQQSDEYELVCGLGNLAWQHEDLKIDRQLFTLPLAIELDKHNGEISIRLADPSLRLELDAIPSEELVDNTLLSDTRREVESAVGHWLAEETFAPIGQVTANGMGANAIYSGRWKREKPHSNPVVSWQPTIIMRPRQQAGLASAFQNIAELIEKSGKIPAGLAPLIDPNSAEVFSPSEEPGATFEIGDELFTPLPLNDRQIEVIRRVDTHAQTIVQGPPGTGKTHMAAALLSHLLAQGKKVLVTAKAERALYELRGKLPKEIRELAVSVISAGRDDMAELKVAIDTITRRADEFQNEDFAYKIARSEKQLQHLQEQRQALLRRWTAFAESEGMPLEFPGYEMPMARAIKKWLDKTDSFDWINSVFVPNLDQPFPLSTNEVEQWFTLLRRQDLNTDTASETADSINFSVLPTTGEMRELISEEQAIDSGIQRLTEDIPAQDVHAWAASTRTDKEQISQTFGIGLKAQRLLQSRESSWDADLLADSKRLDVQAWKHGLESFESDLRAAQQFEESFRELKSIRVDGAFDAFVPIAKTLVGYLESGNAIKTKSDGMPKVGLWTKQVVKDGLPFFESVRINGMPPTKLSDVQGYLDFVEFNWSLEHLRKSWEYDQPDLDSNPVDQLAFWRQRLGELRQSTALASQAVESILELRSAGFAVGWDSLAALGAKLDLLQQFEELEQRHSNVADRYQHLDELFQEEVERNGNKLIVERLKRAVSGRDLSAYSEALESALEHSQSAEDVREMNRLTSSVRSWSPELLTRVLDDPASDQWYERVRQIEDARRWAVVGKQIEHRTPVDVQQVSREIARIDTDISDLVSHLAADRAWTHAVGSSRIDGAMRANLTGYTQAVKRLGKGTGKYAERRRREVRSNLVRCREAVPVWIMPIYRVVEQFDLEENMFDVIIVDEASQAGLDAVFLQYLAPRIVVIGDDRQVSPTSFENEEEVRALAHQYLEGFENFDAWTDPNRSLFDDANMRYGGRITLEEHRRCVPEIIGFSNRYVYEPDNIRLKPVREVAGDRLSPFRITHTPNAFYAGNRSKKVNRVEADALVDRLVATVEDPEYQGKSIGVISLLSTSEQAKYIQARLLERLPSEVWIERDLKIGSSAEFQGAERDVMFLSMVQPNTPGERIAVMNRDSYLQRFNVAVSRAKDQVWLFHSVDQNQLKPEDIRFKLLDYAYGVASDVPEYSASVPVSESSLVSPFDSLFEQRVYNRIVARGYRVIPQFEDFGYRIDLVVQGRDARLAVECDGDVWHSGENAVRDQRRQRELERLGWHFVRIFESDFYLDADEQMDKVWCALDTIGVLPAEYGLFTTGTSNNIEVIEHDEAAANEALSLDSSSMKGLALPGETDLYDEEELGQSIGFNEVLESTDTGDTLETLSRETHIETGFSAEDGKNALGFVQERDAGHRLKLRPERYQEFVGTPIPVKDASSIEISKGLLEIVAVEGPITDDFLFGRYNSASGGRRLSRQMRSKLEPVLRKLIAEGKLIRVAGQDNVVSTPEQPSVRLRALGPRSIHDLPASELEAYVEKAMYRTASSDRETVMRATLGLLGLKRLADKTEELLDVHYRNVMRRSEK